jgi:ribosomal protein S18 acetylase RimI-like enzyme
MTESGRLAIAPIEDDDVGAVVALWRRVDLTRPWNDPAADIAFARPGPASAVLVGRRGPTIVATIMVGHDGHRGWFYYLAVDPDLQGRGLGRTMTDAAESWLRERGVAKVNLMVRAENHKVRAFYQALGYDEQQRITFAKWLDGREPTP